MEIRTDAELARENLTLRHKYKMLKIKYNMVNKALKKVNGPSCCTGPTADFTAIKDTTVKGEKHGHQ